MMLRRVSTPLGQKSDRGRKEELLHPTEGLRARKVHRGSFTLATFRAGRRKALSAFKA